MSLFEDIVNGKEKLSLVGLGYVGMPIAVAFARKIKVVGFDLNAAKIDLYKSGVDPTNEVGDDVIKNTTVEFTADPSKLREAKFHIVAVPTPVNDDHTPDLTPVEGASRILGQNGNAALPLDVVGIHHALLNLLAHTEYAALP